MSFFGKQKKTVSHYDKMTKTPISQLILTLSVPSIISMLITNIYNLVDLDLWQSFKRLGLCSDRVPAVFSPAHSAQRIRKEPPRTLRLGSFPPC